MIWVQQWADVLFLHFPVQARELRTRVPDSLEIDMFDEQAWLSLVLFRLKLRPAGLPFVPLLSSLLELNVRTYVRHRGHGGICFLKMYADNRLAIRAAQLLTPLDYEFAVMVDRRSTGKSRHIECHPASHSNGALFADVFRDREFATAPPGSLDFWLLERYRLFVGRRGGRILTADVEHPPWRASKVEASAVRHNLGELLGLSLANGPALMHESPGVAARFKAFRSFAASHTITAAAMFPLARAVGLRGGQ